jgi:hypothetical protein
VWLKVKVVCGLKADALGMIFSFGARALKPPAEAL